MARGERRQPTIAGLPECLLWEPPAPHLERSKSLVKEWQAGRCAGCGIPGRELVEDHDHTTGYTRGWLCRPCNTSEGGSFRSLLWWWWRHGANPAAIVGVQAFYVNRKGLTVIRGQVGFVPSGDS